MPEANSTHPADSHILIVEDEPKLAELLADYLHAERYATEILHDGNDVVEHVRERKPMLILLDLMLPGKDGLALCREIRAFSQAPIIMVTARVEEIDRLLGLELGADDYVCKPFSPREVVARVKALLRRSHAYAGGESPASTDKTQGRENGMMVDESSYRAEYQGRRLDLTPAEFRLLLLFSRHPGRVFSREQLLDALYDDNRIVTDRTVDTHIKNLRRKLQQAEAPEDCITSVYGVGYRYDAL